MTKMSSTKDSYKKFLLPQTLKYLNKSNEERIKFIKARKFIVYPRAKKILDQFEDLLKEPRGTRMPSFLLVGDSNNGKTSLIKEFARRHPPEDLVEEVYMPIVAIECPPRATVNILYNHILTAILIPYSSSDGITKKIAEINYFFSKVHLKILIIDEIHNVLSSSVSKQKEFMNALKGLSNTLEISIILVGTKDALNATATDLQISSRFRPLALPRWKSNKDYYLFLKSIMKTLPLRRPSTILEDVNVAEKVLELSEGLIGEITKIINDSAIYAIKSGSEHITKKEIEAINYIKPSQARNIFGLDS
jgi:hypothetical protein